MSGTGEVSTDFAGEERAFRIRLGEIRKIEAKCGAGDGQRTGIGEVCRRLAKAAYVLANSRRSDGSLDLVLALASGTEFHADDVREVLYQGLVGADMPSAAATALIRAEIDDRGMRGLLDNAATALIVLMGSQESPPGEPQAGESPATPPSPSTSPSSTEADKLSD